jgi:hypothetical protein
MYKIMIVHKWAIELYITKNITTAQICCQEESRWICHGINGIIHLLEMWDGF